VTTVEAPFYGRIGFADLITDRRFYKAVEVGTDRGRFAKELLTRWHQLEQHPPGFLWCLDPYLPYNEMPWRRTADLMMAAVNLAPFVPYVQIVQLESVDFIKARSDELRHIGFVYLDGNHEKEAVLADLSLWWGKLAAGSVIGGHDLGDHQPGVKAALEAFTGINDVPVHVVSDPESLSWYVEKP
jgi:hypothetical protein